MSEASYQPTSKQLEALRLIASWPEGQPRISKLTARLQLASESVTRSRLKPLIQHGYLRAQREAPGYPADLIVTPAGLRELGLAGAPPCGTPIKGNAPTDVQMFPIKCGPMEPAFDEGEHLTQLSDILPGFRTGDYLLEADGDSMAGPVDAESIYPGDRVHCRPDLAPSNGETVHAEYILENGDRECALGIFHLEDRTGLVTLNKLNPNYSAITRPGEGIIVHGIVINVVRRLRGSNRK